MENASKALIIAGAILLSILIIALGMFILNKATSSADVSTALSENEIQAFNKKFENYAGEQLGSNVIPLISVARSSQAAQTNTKVNKTQKIGITLNPDSGPAVKAPDVGDYDKISKKIQRSHTYYVEFGYDTSTGMVNHITINWSGEPSADPATPTTPTT